MRTSNLAVALVLALGLTACAEDVEDPNPADPQPQTYTPVEYTHSATTPVPTSVADQRLSRLHPVVQSEDLQKPDLPQPAR